MKKFILAAKSCIILLLVLLICTHTVQAQTRVVLKGKITEVSGNKPLGGASVTEVNENDRQVSGVTADDNGNFLLRISDPKNKLRVAFIGFETKTVDIGNKTTFNFSLSRDSTKSMDVIVLSTRRNAVSNGMTITSKRDITGAVTSIKADVLADQPATSIDQMLQGRAAGVQVVASSGDPGAGVDIRIRGATSLNGNNDPLYIIDGIPITSTPFDNTNSAQAGYAKINPIADLNPLDIESIDILKDGSAAAIYGSRAANGVIIITTKRGRQNYTKVQLTTQHSISEAPRSIPVLNGSQYKVMRLEAEQNNGNINPNNDVIRALMNDPTYFSYWYYQSDTKWMDYLTRLGFSQNYNLNVSGGGESVRYAFITSYSDIEGSTIRSSQKRLTGRFNLDYTVSKRLHITAQIPFSRSKVNNLPNTSSGGSVLQTALLKAPCMPVYDVDLSTGKPLTSYLSLGGIQGGMDNPVAFAQTITNEAYSYNLNPNVRLDYDLLKGLKFVNTTSLEYIGSNTFLYEPAIATGLIWNDQTFNYIGTTDNERTTVTVRNNLTYFRSLGTKYKFSGVFGNEFTNAKAVSLNEYGYGNPSDQIQTLNGPARIKNIYTSTSTDHLLSFYLNGAVVYDDKLSFQVTVRRDGSSKFGDSRKFGNFPAFSGYWRISTLPFIKKHLPFISDLKFRPSWGLVGSNSALSSFGYISQYAPGANYLGYTGVTQSNAELNNIQWEVAEQTNLGLDMGMFQDRFRMALDVYNKVTKKLIYAQQLPSSSGINGTLYTNLGDIQNRGIELDLYAEILRAKSRDKLSWSVDLNISRNVNKVLSLPGGTLTFTSNIGGFVNQVKQGDGFGTFYGYKFMGVYATDDDAVVKDAKGNKVFQADGITPKYMKIGSETGNAYKGGDAIFQDLNHDGIIDDQDKVLVGNANPTFFGGFNNIFTYKGISLRLFIQYQYGNDIINGTKYNLEKMNTTDNQAVSVLSRWRKQGDITNMPRALANDTRNSLASSRWVENGSYARIKSLVIGYDLPRKFVKRLGLKALTMALTGYNLYTWTDYTGIDPEIGISGSPSFIGVDNAFTPQAKSFTFSMNITF